MVRTTLSLVFLFGCSGGGTTIDAGSDAATDVVSEPYHPETSPPTATILDLTAGAQHTCMLIGYGGTNAVYCFGKDGALGGTKSGLLTVASNGVGMAPNFLSIASGHGAGHTCGIDTNKLVWCWGDDTLGQCGQGNPGTNVPVPTQSLDFNFGPAKATMITVGTSGTCELRDFDGKLACWGDNTNCELDLYAGNACTTDVSSAEVANDFASVFKGATAIGLGAIHGCTVGTPNAGGNSSLFCYGDNASLEAGPTGKTVQTPASQITTTKPIISLALGDAHTCYVTDSPHQLFCFGKNDVHQAGTTATTPIDPSTATEIVLPMSALANSVATSANETCVIDVMGAMWCFGQGHGANIDAITTVKDVAKIAMGGGHTCVIGHLPTDKTSDPGSILCWGDNTNGQVGQTAGGTIAMPTAVMIPALAPQ